MERLLDLPFARARALVRSGAPVHVMFNPIEYHGPHLSLHNDSVVSHGLSRALHEALLPDHPDWPYLVAGDVEAGAEPVPAPGSRPVDPGDAHRLLETACRSVVELGARRIVISTFHGSPVHNAIVDRCARDLARRGVRVMCPLNVVLRRLTDPDPAPLAGLQAHLPDEARRHLASRPQHDLHAGLLETSLSLHFAPGTVGDLHRVRPVLTPAPDPGWARVAGLAARAGKGRLALELTFLAELVAWLALRPFPGYTGMPHLASAELGAVLAGILVPELADVARRVFDRGERCPGPILSWVASLTLDGRLVPVPLPRVDA